jgi:peptidoglycan hydrolase-like protein with peptidoglycan-binding domain
VPGGADGAFGKGTTVAVKKVQEEAGLGADGVAGASTLRAIDARLSRASSSS